MLCSRRSYDQTIDGHTSDVSSVDQGAMHARKDDTGADVASATATSGQTATAKAPVTNGICHHVACSKQRFCIVAELKRVKSNYSSARRDEFRIRAVERAIHALEQLHTPLVTSKVTTDNVV